MKPISYLMTVILLILSNHRASSQSFEILRLTASDDVHDTVITDFRDNILLDYKKTHITFHFGHTVPTDSTPLQYQLINFDGKPHPAESQRSANYINLPGGTYTFVISSVPDPQIKKQVSFTIEEAFWQEDWFIPALVGYLLMLIGFVWFSIQTVKARQQLRLHALRNKIAADLHDDIGGTLANINLMMELALKQKDQVQLSQIHHRVSQDAKDMMLNMRGMMGAIHPGSDKAIDFFEKLRSSFAQTVQAHQLEFTGDYQIPETLRLTLEQQHNVFLLFKEIINNTIRHANAKEITTIVRELQGWMMIQISDNGRGFDIASETSGNGLRNIRQRIKEIGGTIELQSGLDGTKYQLAFPVT